jgi:hypothetical protein
MAAGHKTGGRTKGTPNKTTALLKDAILEAAVQAGKKEGLVGYLTRQADDNPAAFLTLLGKVLPLTLQGDPEKPLVMQHNIKPAERLRDMVIQVAERSGETGIALPN